MPGAVLEGCHVLFHPTPPPAQGLQTSIEGRVGVSCSEVDFITNCLLFIRPRLPSSLEDNINDTQEGLRS